MSQSCLSSTCLMTSWRSLRLRPRLSGAIILQHTQEDLDGGEYHASDGQSFHAHGLIPFYGFLPASSRLPSLRNFASPKPTLPEPSFGERRFLTQSLSLQRFI